MSGCLLVDRFNTLAHKSQQLFDGFAWRLVQTFVFPTGGMISLVNPWLLLLHHQSSNETSQRLLHQFTWRSWFQEVKPYWLWWSPEFFSGTTMRLIYVSFPYVSKNNKTFVQGNVFLFGLLFPKTAGVESESEIGDQQTWLNVTSTQL